MIDIGSTNFYFSLPNISGVDLKIYSENLFDSWAKIADDTLSLQDFSISLEVEEGSIKGKGRILATAAAIYIAVGQWGSFCAGVQTIKSQILEVSDFLVKEAEVEINQPIGVKKSRRSSGALGKIDVLFKKVQRGEITPEEAIRRTEIILNSEDGIPQELMQEIKNEFLGVPVFHKQIPLFVPESPLIPINGNQHGNYVIVNNSLRDSRNKKDKFRVKIWRGARGDLREVESSKI